MKKEVLKLRIVADTEEDIFADVLAKPSCNFLKLHHFIIDLFKLDKLEMASFYLSNDEWDKGEEITLFDMNSDEDEFSSMSMETTPIINIYQKTNKILYVHDFLNMNIFYVEILEVNQIELDQSEIELIHHFGNFKPKKVESNDGIDNINLDEINEIFDEYDEDSINGDFDELDEDFY